MELTPFTATLWLIFLFFAVIAIATRVRGRVRLGFTWRRPAPWGDAGRGVLIGLAAMAAVFCVELAAGLIDVDRVAPSGSRLLAALGMFVPWAIFEELAFRVLILVGALVLFKRPWAALAVSALLFGLAHVPNDDATALSVLSTVVGGCMYGLAFLRTGRLWLPLLLHLTWNFAQGPIFGFPVSGDTDHSTAFILQHASAGPAAVTGGAYGPEGGLLGISARLLVIGLVLLATHQTYRSPLLLGQQPRDTPRDHSHPPATAGGPSRATDPARP
ncbi:CPBP family intramembrane glutamic endopeptidase [Paractinoplanes rhizophilus]|uniref:CPBP family intramembrane glutamic endopeptidase n=1 Tax=Paractinoplanes rhizophilus TaxID=1416877 RepID=A0ABW2HTA9_9ACTN